jgi:hypothetical protein
MRKSSTGPPDNASSLTCGPENSVVEQAANAMVRKNSQDILKRCQLIMRGNITRRENLVNRANAWNSGFGNRVFFRNFNLLFYKLNI